jgi:hypothetical protein
MGFLAIQLVAAFLIFNFREIYATYNLPMARAIYIVGAR